MVIVTPMLMKKSLSIPIIIWLALSLSGCGTMWKTTVPERTSLDQVLVSTAAERAARLLTTDAKGQIITDLGTRLGKCFVDAKNFRTGDEKYATGDEKYALQVIRNSFLTAGVVLVSDIKKADTIIEIATGALSVDSSSSLLGIPAMAIPIPLAGTVQIPEIPFYKKSTNRGLAKFAIGLYDARTGKIRAKPFTTVGTAKVDSWEVLLFFKFMDNDLQLPEQYESFPKKLQLLR